MLMGCLHKALSLGAKCPEEEVFMASDADISASLELITDNFPFFIFAGNEEDYLQFSRGKKGKDGKQQFNNAQP